MNQRAVVLLLRNCFKRHKRVATKNLNIVEKDLDFIMKNTATSATELTKIIHTIPVHIGTWRIFKNKHVLDFHIDKGRQGEGPYRPMSLEKVKSYPLLKKVLIELRSTIKN